MKKQTAKSPLRIDLAGGFLDIWPIHALIKDCHVVNCSIPVFTSVTFQPTNAKEDSKIHVSLDSLNRSQKNTFTDLEEFLSQSEMDCMKLLRVQLSYWMDSKENFQRKKEGFHIHLQSESSEGSGLGASSSLAVGITKVMTSFFETPLSEMEMLLLCRDLETAVMHRPAGIQDYIPAFKEEANLLYTIECTPFGPKWKSRKAPMDFFKNHMLVIDTGKPHHSGTNNWEILRKAVEKDQYILSGLHYLRDSALEMLDICEREDWPAWTVLLEKEQELRKRFFPHWLTPIVIEISDLLLAHGAESVKLCGAGGGGCLIVLATNLKKKKEIIDLCFKKGIKVIASWQ